MSIVGASSFADEQKSKPVVRSSLTLSHVICCNVDSFHCEPWHESLRAFGEKMDPEAVLGSAILAVALNSVPVVEGMGQFWEQSM